MIVALGSAFRNSQRRGHLPRYLQQVAAVRDALHAAGHRLFVIAAEGDSVDGTREALTQWLARLVPTGVGGCLAACDHGQREFGSTEEPARFQALAGVANAIFTSVPPDADALVYVESDLIWEAATILDLLSELRAGRQPVDVIAPLIFAGDLFYDVFAYRGLDGTRFAPFAPYHATLVHTPGVLTEVASVGSCLVMRGEVARTCRVPPQDGLVGFCRDVRAHGWRILVDPALRVRHPA